MYLGAHGSPESCARYAQALGTIVAVSTPALIIPVPAAPGGSDRGKRWPTVNELWEAFGLVYSRRADGSQTRELDNYRDAIRPVLAAHGDLPTAHFDRPKLRQARDVHVKTCNRRTVNHRVGRVVRVFRWGASEDRGLVPDTVPAGLDLLAPLPAMRSEAEEPGEVEAVAVEVVEVTLLHLNRVVAGMVRVQLHTGMRPGEAMGLCPAHLDMSGQAWVADFELHKAAHHGHARAVVIGPQARAALESFLRPNEPKLPGFRPRDAHPKGRGGLRYTRHSYHQAVERACKRAGVEQWTLGRVDNQARS